MALNNSRHFLQGENLVSYQRWDVHSFMRDVLAYMKCVMANNPTTAEIEEISNDIKILKGHGGFESSTLQKWTLRSIDAQIKTMQYMKDNNLEVSPIIKKYDEPSVRFQI